LSNRMVDTNEVESHLIERYEIRRRLGKGAYGIVWKANERKTGRIVALKKIFDAFRNATDAQRTFREILFLQEFSDHPNIIKLLNVVAAKNDRDIYLVFEFMETDLHAVIRKGGILQDAHQRYIMAQLLRATAFLHSGNVIHRDHKPSNILLDSDCLVKICDFGLARSLSQLPQPGKDPDHSVPALTEYVATRWYRAPEILLSSPSYTKGVDMWSLGCILAEMLLGKPLFPGDSTFDQIERIIRAIPTPSRADIDIIGSQYAQTVVERAQRKPKTTIQDIMPKGTASDGIDLIKQLLVFNPEKRPSAESCLKHPYVVRFNSKKDNKDLNLGYNVIPPINDDVQLTVDEYRQRLYKMIKERRVAQREERKRREVEKASGDCKKDDPDRTLTGDNNNTIIDNDPNEKLLDDKVPMKTQSHISQSHLNYQSPQKQDPKRISRSAQNLNGSNLTTAQNRHKSAPIHRNNSRGEFTRQYERNQTNANLMRKTETKMEKLSVTGKVVSSAHQKYRHPVTKTQANNSRNQRRFTSNVHKNLASTAAPVHNMGVSHNQQYGTVTSKWLHEHN